MQNEDSFLETSVGILLETDVIPHYACNVYFKKDFSAVDNIIDIRFEVTDNGHVNQVKNIYSFNQIEPHIILYFCIEIL